MRKQAGAYLLMADDYGLCGGVSQGIIDLARAGRLSGTSAMVTMPGWGEAAKASNELVSLLSFGLHLNLTLGAPAGPMARHAPQANLPPISHWIAASWSGRIDIAEIEAEIDRQIDLFRHTTGRLPDHIDGHHHVHALPGIRMALARCVQRHYPAGLLPLIRDPGDRLMRILKRRSTLAKALLLKSVSTGTQRTFSTIAAPMNDGFAGFSDFIPGTDFAAELARFEQARGRFHLVMCHPGYDDEALAGLDSVTERRQEELVTLMADDSLPQRILHPARFRNGEGFIDWEALRAQS
ncbi:ChbG/HpnK family deacetylase [Allorhizobium sp. BGMRC 0089]|uniref:ChbG/HpnK family deacetylase n=1 Tax=Allorhizobium sonneratiae TaxID=2934936 RepID=UPI002033DAEB|nr:ChbG/HpnK family deacetylase [Allorhizobium sonneratiae]MCM2294284.1 ChbG/HpnK family deacetylase [Allorhizobium sonneratiae]